MDTRSDSAAPPTYQDFQPPFEWLREDDSNTLTLNLAGFRREQLKVQIDTSGNLKISGERPLDGNKFSRFQREFRVPRNCNIHGIHAKLENGVLSVIVPKQTRKPSPRDQTASIQESPAGLKTDPTPAQESLVGSKSEPTATKESLVGSQSEPAATQESPASPRMKQGQNSRQESEARQKDLSTSTTEEESKSKSSRSDKSADTQHQMMPMTEDQQKMEPTNAVTGEMTKWSFKNVTYKDRMDSLAVGIKRHRRLMVNLLVASTVIAALGIYLTNSKFNISLNLKKISTKLNSLY